jgi:hypothetical protein
VVFGSKVLGRIIFQNYSAGDETLRIIFCDAFENGAFRIFIYMIEEYKEVLKPKSNMECIYLMNLALKTDCYKMISIFRSELGSIKGMAVLVS